MTGTVIDASGGIFKLFLTDCRCEPFCECKGRGNLMIASYKPQQRIAVWNCKSVQQDPSRRLPIGRLVQDDRGVFYTSFASLRSGIAFQAIVYNMTYSSLTLEAAFGNHHRSCHPEKWVDFDGSRRNRMYEGSPDSGLLAPTTLRWLESLVDSMRLPRRWYS